MDRISELPIEILHQILCFLPTKTATRTTVLSKLWHLACYTNPHLNFDESDFYPASDEYQFQSDFDNFDESDIKVYLEARRRNGRFVHTHGEFSRIICDILGTYCHEDRPISTFKLCITFNDLSLCEGLVEKWLRIIAQKKVLQVSLLARKICRGNLERYNLSADTLFAMELLQKLELYHCKILLKQNTIKCYNIKNLSLCYVSISESTLDCIISYCRPHITTISLYNCIGFNCIRVSNLPNLSSLSILYCPIEEVDVVDAPNLLSFEYGNRDSLFPYSDDHRIYLHSLNIGTCLNLRRVEFVNIEIIDEDALFHLIQKLPFINELSLRCCEKLEKMKISSSSLELCSIAECGQLKQAVFYVPMLLSLVFSVPSRLPSLSFLSDSSQCRISINYLSRLWDVDQFIHLRRFLVELNDMSVDLAWRIPSFKIYHISKQFRASSEVHHLPTPEVENLILSDNAYSTEMSYSTYFDNIFWTCSPKSLTVLQCSRRFRKFLRQQLLNKYGYWRLIKCSWKKYLVSVRIEYKKKKGIDWVSVDRKMLAANPRIIEEIHSIRFKQIERNEKNKSSYISRCIPRWIVHSLECS